MGIAYYVSHRRPSLGDADDAPAGVRVRPGGVRVPRHGSGDDRGRLLRPGHRQRAIGVRALGHRGDSRASRSSSKSDYGFDVHFERAKDLLEENDGAGNTFKATAKPVLIGTAVVGATTMIFSIIMQLTSGLDAEHRQAVDPAPAVLARPDHRRRGDLLVHRRVGAGGQHRRLSRGGVHQGEHQARYRRDEGVGRGQQEGRGDLHAVRAEGDVQHLPDRVLLDARVRVPRAVSSSSAT